jgi:hypothetical protein
MTRDYENLKGRPVKFFVRDIYLPDPTAILSELHDGDKLDGIVVDLSDDARDETAVFAVIKVPSLRDLCIVSVEKISPGSASDPEPS